MLVETISNGKFTTINPNLSRPKTFKQLRGFLVCNGGRDCFSKFQGNVWMISKTGNWEKIVKNIPDLTYNEYLKISLK